MPERIAVIGAGAWGLAVARMLSLAGHIVSIWEGQPEALARLKEYRGAPDRLPGLSLPESVEICENLGDCLYGADIVCLVVPSQVMATVARLAKQAIPPSCTIVNLAKGIEHTTLRRMSEVIIEETMIAAEHVVTMSGPSHAEEVVLDMPTTVVAAGCSPEVLAYVQQVFSHRAFRVYTSDDLLGVELGGSLKNVIALAAGIADGLGLGDNTKGALITRGLAEISRLGLAMGARRETFAGLSGIGDLITTCASRHSRNRYVGEQIGRGRQLADVLAEMTMVAEGVDTTRSGVALAERYQVEMPITAEVYRVLFENKLPADAVQELMGRSLRPEMWT